MAASTLTSKGQVVVPKSIRTKMHLHAGDRLDFVLRDDGSVVIRPVVSDVRELRGALAKKGRRPVSIARMNAAIRRRAGGRQ